MDTENRVWIAVTQDAGDNGFMIDRLFSSREAAVAWIESTPNPSWGYRQIMSSDDADEGWTVHA